ncbi:MAG: FAD-dependent oxidoreductase [Halomonadaceae bacterium]|nr:FAD-dependent oxidoreductase [Halomonadaceae bacterium]
MLPGRSEFGDLITNLTEELKRSSVEILTQRKVSPEELLELGYDHVLMATGSSSYSPSLECMGQLAVSQATEILKSGVIPHGHVVVYDPLGDWTGLGIAELLAKEGAKVTLAVNGLYPGESLKSCVRDSAAPRLHNLGVKVLTYARVFGFDDDSVYLYHIAGAEPRVIDGVDHRVLPCDGVPQCLPRR